MRIIQKMNEKSKKLNDMPTVTIAFLGDSVTQGCFDLYRKSTGAIETFFQPEDGYPPKVRQIFARLFPNVPLNIINAGISGDNATNAYTRLERDVLRFSPDLCVVCFGLNDCNNSAEGALSEYRISLQAIFSSLQAKGIEVIFMTPNYMCTELSEHIHDEAVRTLAENVSHVQNSGRLEEFLNTAKSVAREMNVPVCDCYAKWKLMHEGGVNTTDLLANHINHPEPFMHWMFANALVETMFTA